MPGDLVLIAGNANRQLAQEIAVSLGTRLAAAEVSQFSDGEVCVQVNDNVRGADIFVLQPTCPPVNLRVTIM